MLCYLGNALIKRDKHGNKFIGLGAAVKISYRRRANATTGRKIPGLNRGSRIWQEDMCEPLFECHLAMAKRRRDIFNGPDFPREISETT